jgi:capsular exopolysaccharide synthesis family protein
LSEPTTRILDLSDYWHMVRIRKWTVLVVAVLVAAASAAYVLLKPPVYHAQATVQVNTIVNPLTGIKSGGNTSDVDMATESAIAKSYSVAQAVQQQLKLSLTPQQLSKGVSVSIGRSGTIMTIGYTAKTPQQAQAVAQAFATNYLSQRKLTVTTDIQQAVNQYSTLAKSTEANLAKLRAQYAAASSTTTQHIIASQIATASKNLSNYVGQIADLQSAAAIDANSVGSITQQATVPTAPTGPALPLAIAIGLVLGTILGAALAIILGLRANRVGGRDELAIHLSAPVMAVIPKVDGWDKADDAELVTRLDPSAPASEAYRTLATNVRFYRSQQPLRVLVVTSALPSEGKSATAANLAVVLAETGLRTVLVDADLRRPRASRFLGVGEHVGLHEALDGSRDLVDVIQATDIENLWIVGSGSVPRDPVSLLAGPNAAGVFDGLRRVADVVICDAPPILPVADASVLAEASDAVLFVHDPGISNRTALEDAVKQLRTAGGAIIGGVYNNISAAQRNYLGYSSYDSYYGQDRKGRKKATLAAATAQAGSPNGSATKGSSTRVPGLD